MRAKLRGGGDVTLRIEDLECLRRHLRYLAAPTGQGQDLGEVRTGERPRVVEVRCFGQRDRST
jgi:hypothetical protein